MDQGESPMDVGVALIFPFRDAMKKRLRELVDIQAGHQFRGRVVADPVGNVRVIQMKDLDDERRVDVSQLMTIQFDDPPKNCLASGNDVLFLSRGNRLTASRVPPVAEGALVSGLFFILRVRDKRISPAYLAWAINQASFQTQVRSCIRGTDVAIIAKADLQELWVPLPPLEVQNRIVLLDELLLREKELCSALAQKRTQLLHALSLKAAGELP